MTKGKESCDLGWNILTVMQGTSESGLKFSHGRGGGKGVEAGVFFLTGPLIIWTYLLGENCASGFSRFEKAIISSILPLKC